MTTSPTPQWTGRIYAVQATMALTPQDCIYAMELRSKQPLGPWSPSTAPTLDKLVIDFFNDMESLIHYEQLENIPAIDWKFQQGLNRRPPTNYTLVRDLTEQEKDTCKELMMRGYAEHAPTVPYSFNT